MYEQAREDFEEFIADEGSQCDHCGRIFVEGESIWSNTRLRASWHFCSIDEGMLGTTTKSRKVRFVQGVMTRWGMLP